MNCLHCAAPLSEHEYRDMWHRRCIRLFFGTEAMPKLQLTNKSLVEMLGRSLAHGQTVSGVQKKISLDIEQAQEGDRLTLRDYMPGYIIKPAQAEYKALPEAEHLLMSMAKASGVATVPFGLLQQEDDGAYAYITRRVDRLVKSSRDSRRASLLAMEDFAQLSGRLSQDKYLGSYEQCAKIIAKYSRQSGLDLSEFFLRLVVSFVGGNSDMHLKNFSLIEKGPGSREFTLSPAYDLLPVNLILPEDKEETALTLGDKKRNLRRSDFLELAGNCGIAPRAAESMLQHIVSLKEVYLSMTEDSFLPEDMKKSFCKLIQDRIRRLEA